MSEFAFIILGAVIAFLGIVVSALVGFDAVRKRPVIGLAIAATILSGGVLILFAILAQLRSAEDIPATEGSPVLQETPESADQGSFEVEVAVALTQTAAAMSTPVSDGSVPQPATADDVVSEPQVEQGCLDKALFVEIMNRWHEADRNNPGPAIQELDVLFDQSSGSIGQQWTTGPFTVTRGPSGSVVYWTNTMGSAVIATDPSGVLLDLFLQGGWGIRSAWDTDVTVPTPGRSAWLCQRLDPERDFPWWGR